MYPKRYYDPEKWSEIALPPIFAEKYIIEVSNYGKVRKTTLSTMTEKIIPLSRTSGYPSVTFTILPPITEKQSSKFVTTRKVITDLKNKINQLLKNIDDKETNELVINETKLELMLVTAKYKSKYRKAETKRKVRFGFLVHRMVALHFCNKPSEDHHLVAHIDYDKEDNHHSNLQWMSREENVGHQKKSPVVISSKIKAKESGKRNNNKLTEKQVMILKKRINEGVSLKDLAKKSAVSETQLLRIKRGINWAKVPAAL